MKKGPLISVVMPAFNSASFLPQAVESILEQTYPFFEFIIIDDGSTDETASILENYARQDPRISILRHEKNLGLVAALNNGFAIAQGKYIARMDADDISAPQRFELQVAFLENNPGIGMIGTAIRILDAQGQLHNLVPYPVDDWHIKWVSLLTSPFAHPSIMLRRSILGEINEVYRAEFPCEDYDLAVRLLAFVPGANLPTAELFYRVHRASVTSTKIDESIRKRTGISYEQIKRELPGVEATRQDIEKLKAVLAGSHAPGAFRSRAEASLTYLKLWQAFSIGKRENIHFSAVHREVLVTVAKLSLYPPFQTGTWAALRGLCAADPLWIWFVLRELRNILAIKWFSRRISRLRRGKES